MINIHSSRTVSALATVAFVSLAVINAWAGDPSPEAKGEDIAKQLESKNAGWRDLSATADMTLKDASGSEAKRRFAIKVLEKPAANGGDWSLITFDAPADVKGTAVLSHAKVEGEDDQWLYLPSAKRVKRVATQNRTGSFVGSEFSFEDLTGNETRKYSWKYVATEPCAADQCFVLEAKPKDPGSAYSKRVLRVDTKELRIQSIDFHDRGGTRTKTLTYDAYKQLKNKFWRAQAWTMKNHQTGKSTTLTFTAMNVENGYAQSDFAAGKLGDAK